MIRQTPFDVQSTSVTGSFMSAQPASSGKLIGCSSCGPEWVARHAKTATIDATARHPVAAIPYRAIDYARLMYAPSAVSTRIFSPSLMNGGTCTTSPVSTVAGLVTLLAVADLMPGSVFITVIST